MTLRNNAVVTQYLLWYCCRAPWQCLGPQPYQSSEHNGLGTTAIPANALSPKGNHEIKCLLGASNSDELAPHMGNKTQQTCVGAATVQTLPGLVHS